MLDAEIFETKDQVILITECPKADTNADIRVDLAALTVTVINYKSRDNYTYTLPVACLPERGVATFNNGVLEVVCPKRISSDPVVPYVHVNVTSLGALFRRDSRDDYDNPAGYL